MIGDVIDKYRIDEKPDEGDMGSTMAGKAITKYNIEQKLGEGGMGVVYKAWDTALERWVALKMLHPTLVHDEKFLQRFRSEARALAKLENPNIVTVFDLQETDSGLLIVMQYVEGVTLADKLQEIGPIPFETALPLIKQLLTALGHAHQVGVIHRDLKPGNVMLTPQGLVKITDFGMAKIQFKVGLTQSTATGGTLYYMPPEQVQSLANVDQRSDVYSLGMTFYEMLAGRLPFEKHENVYTLLKIIIKGKFPPPEHYNPAVPKELSAIVMKAIAKSPAKRHQSAEEMLAAIARLEAKQKPAQLPSSTKARPQRRTLVASIVALVLIVSAILLFLSRGQLPAPIANATVSISTDPAGATVFWDGDSIGLTPIEARAAKPGLLSLSIQKQNYLAVDTSVAIASGRDVVFSFSLKPAVATIGSATISKIEARADSQKLEKPAPVNPIASATVGGIRILSQPSEADILVNNRWRGKTPHTIKDLTPGAYTIVLKKSGHQDFSASVVVQVGAEEKVEAELIPLMGKLNIVVKPSGLIYIDDKLERANSSGPYETSLPVGSHRVRMESPGLGLLEKTVNLEADQLQNLAVDFNKMVNLTVTAFDTAGNGLHAEIYVDGASHGQTPKTLSLRVGRHTITVSRQGYTLVGEARVIDLEENVNQSMEFTLRETP
jgi:serine/threonine protein kinase